MKAVATSNNEYRSLQAYSMRATKRCLTRLVVEHKKQQIDAELEFQINAYAAPVVDAGTKWMASGMEMSPETIASLVDSSVPANNFTRIIPSGLKMRLVAMMKDMGKKLNARQVWRGL
jgi:glycine cleavage system regulatory protein